MKKVLSMLLIVCMVIGISACGNNSGKSSNANLSYEIGDTGGLTVPFGNGEEIRYLGINQTQSTSTYIFDKLSEITGLNVKLESVPVSSFAEKIQVVVASKNLPEIIGDGITNGIYGLNDLAAQGAFAAVNDHIDSMPNFKRLFGEGAEDNWIFKSYAASDGKLYGLPLYDTSRDVNHGVLYRKDIFDKYGIEMWNSTEEFYQALKTLKEKEPDSVPLSSKTGDALINAYSTSWGIVGYDMYFNEEEKVWKYSDTDSAMKDMLDFLKKLYNEGLIDPEFLTCTQADWTSKMTSNKSFVTFDWIGRLDMFQSQSQIEGYDLRYGNPIGPKQSIITLVKVLPSFSAVAKNGKEELSMKLMDFMYSDAGAELMTLGIKGETYEIADNGKARYLEFEEGKKVEITDLEEKYGMFMQGTYRRMDKRSCYFNYTEREQEAQDIGNTLDNYEPADPVLSFDKGDQEKINDIRNSLITRFKEFMFKYIVDKSYGDKEWNDWLANAKKLGEDEIVKIYNDAHKRLGF